MHVKINTAALVDHEAAIHDSAAKAVRMGFNPSTLPRVDAIKALAAALISQCQEMQDNGEGNAREAAIAMTQIQGASMFAVAAATANL